MQISIVMNNNNSNFNASMKALEYEYSDDEASTSSEDSRTSMHKARLLLIDELDTKSQMCHKVGNKTSPNRASTKMNVITSVAPCPCCKSYVHCKKKKTNLIASSPEREPSSFSSFVNYFMSSPRMDDGGVSTNSSIGAHQKEEQTRPDVNFEYSVIKCMMETWISKKGSGNDVFGSTSWKPRWCQLVLAKVPFFEVPVPLLLVSWHFSMPKPTTIIILDKKIAIGIDALSSDATSSNNTDYVYRFDVVSDNEDELSSTRSFSALTMETRNSWVDEINDAISNFQRERKSYRRANSYLSLPPPIPRTRKRYTIDNSELDGLDLVY